MIMKSESTNINIRNYFIRNWRFQNDKVRISTIEKKKIKNEERIKTLSEENNILTANLKLLNQKKEMFEKMDQDLADLIPDKKKTVAN